MTPPLPGVRVSTTECTLGSISDRETLREACFSPDGTAVAFIVTADGRYVVNNANGVRAVYDHAQHLVVGPTGKMTAHQARTGHQALVAINGVHDEGYRWVSDPILHPDGTATAFWAVPAVNSFGSPYGDDYFVKRTGQTFGPYDSCGCLAFSRIDGRFMYSTQKQSDSFYVIDGSQGPRFDWVTWPAVKPDDGSIWYWGRRSDTWFLVREDSIVDKSESILVNCGPFFGDKDLMAYWRSEGGRWFAIFNGEVVGTAEEPVDGIDSIAVSALGTIAYAAKAGDEIYVTVGKGRQGPFDAVGAMVFSPNGNRLGYMARSAARGYFVIDGERGEEFDAIMPEEGTHANYLEDVPYFNHNGSSFAYRARFGNKDFVVVDGEAGELFDGISGTPSFVPGSSSLVYGASQSLEEFFIIDGTRTESYERIWSPIPFSRDLMWVPAFSHDAEKLVFGALSQGQLLWKVVSIGGGRK